eukprot:30996-Pelagococcus_subviridis.AAC.18
MRTPRGLLRSQPLHRGGRRRRLVRHLHGRRRARGERGRERDRQRRAHDRVRVGLQRERRVRAVDDALLDREVARVEHELVHVVRGEDGEDDAPGDRSRVEVDVDVERGVRHLRGRVVGLRGVVRERGIGVRHGGGHGDGSRRRAAMRAEERSSEDRGGALQPCRVHRDLKSLPLPFSSSIKNWRCLLPAPRTRYLVVYLPMMMPTMISPRTPRTPGSAARSAYTAASPPCDPPAPPRPARPRAVCTPPAPRRRRKPSPGART